MLILKIAASKLAARGIGDVCNVPRNQYRVQTPASEARIPVTGHSRIAVGFSDSLLQSRNEQAIERLGAKLDGVLRNHLIAANGTMRDTCVYSIIVSEWPAVKAHLTWLLKAAELPQE